MYYTYILKSKVKDRYYIGHCLDPVKRLILHNSGRSISTKAYIPWELVYSEEFATRSEAMKREYALKRIKNRSVLEKIINKLI